MHPNMHATIVSGLVKGRGQNNYGNFGQNNGKDDRFKPSLRPLPADLMPNTKVMTTEGSNRNYQTQLHERFGPKSPESPESLRIDRKKRPIAEVSTCNTNTADTTNSCAVGTTLTTNSSMDIRFLMQDDRNGKRSRQDRNEFSTTISATAAKINRDDSSLSINRNFSCQAPINIPPADARSIIRRNSLNVSEKDNNSTFRMPVLRPSAYKHNSTTTTANHSSGGKSSAPNHIRLSDGGEPTRADPQLSLRSETAVPTITYPLTLVKTSEQRSASAIEAQRLTEAARQHLQQLQTLNTEGINDNHIITSAWSFMSMQDKKKTFALPVSDRYAPGYSDTIQHKMALSDMKAKHERGEYPSLEAFGQDIQLIVDNCNLYNASSSRYKKQAAAFLNAWEVFYREAISRRLTTPAAVPTTTSVRCTSNNTTAPSNLNRRIPSLTTNPMACSFSNDSASTMNPITSSNRTISPAAISVYNSTNVTTTNQTSSNNVTNTAIPTVPTSTTITATAAVPAVSTLSTFDSRCPSLNPPSPTAPTVSQQYNAAATASTTVTPGARATDTTADATATISSAAPAVPTLNTFDNRFAYHRPTSPTITMHSTAPTIGIAVASATTAEPAIVLKSKKSASRTHNNTDAQIQHPRSKYLENGNYRDVWEIVQQMTARADNQGSTDTSASYTNNSKRGATSYAPHSRIASLDSYLSTSSYVSCSTVPPLMPSVYQKTHPTTLASKTITNTNTATTMTSDTTISATTTASTYAQTDDITTVATRIPDTATNTITTATQTDPTFPALAPVLLDKQVEILKFLTLHGDAVYKEKAMRELMVLATQR